MEGGGSTGWGDVPGTKTRTFPLRSTRRQTWSVIFHAHGGSPVAASGTQTMPRIDSLSSHRLQPAR
jgi:hypothetical protein